MDSKTILRVTNWLSTALLCAIAAGVPLIFSQSTQSVFEINKFLVLRISSILLLLLWLFQHLFFSEEKQEACYKVFGLRWRKVGLEIPVLIWIFSNVLSTVFSQNFKLSLIGAYDRWEGIFTVINYAVLIYLVAKMTRTAKQVHILICTLLGAGVITGIFGIYQSMGFDSRHWSVEEAARVFSTVNNPVHYCPYLAMLIPLAMAWLFSLDRFSRFRQMSGSYRIGVKILLLGSVFLLYLNQFLSFSRAAWLGFIFAMSIFYMMNLNLLDLKSRKRFMLDTAFTGFAIATYYLIYIFRIHEKYILAFPVMLLVWGAYSAILYLNSESRRQPKEIGIYLSMLFLLCLNFFIPFEFHRLLFQWLFHFSVSALILLLFFYFRSSIRQAVLARFLIVILFGQLQFCAISLLSVFLYLVALGLFSFLLLDRVGDTHEGVTKENRYYLVAFLFLFCGVFIVPTLKDQVKYLFSHNRYLTVDQKDVKNTSQNAEEKVGTYRNVAIKGTARTSMWKSSVPWIKDYSLIGSGLDTIKYLYPTYRRSDYGVLEGGHNFTPDRLHNEYLNTLATKGVIGFLSYYGLVILGFYFLILSQIFRFKDRPHGILLMSTVASVTIYLGQVLFNFGVVATLVLFYFLIGLALAMNQIEVKENNDKSI